MDLNKKWIEFSFRCARDKYLLQNLEYVSNLMVGKEAHVYKYAGNDGLFFECQIALTIKEPGQEFCEVIREFIFLFSLFNQFSGSFFFSLSSL